MHIYSAQRGSPCWARNHSYLCLVSQWVLLVELLGVWRMGYWWGARESSFHVAQHSGPKSLHLGRSESPLTTAKSVYTVCGGLRNYSRTVSPTRCFVYLLRPSGLPFLPGTNVSLWKERMLQFWRQRLLSTQQMSMAMPFDLQQPRPLNSSNIFSKNTEYYIIDYAFREEGRHFW